MRKFSSYWHQKIFISVVVYFYQVIKQIFRRMEKFFNNKMKISMPGSRYFWNLKRFWKDHSSHKNATVIYAVLENTVNVHVLDMWTKLTLRYNLVCSGNVKLLIIPSLKERFHVSSLSFLN